MFARKDIFATPSIGIRRLKDCKRVANSQEFCKAKIRICQLYHKFSHWSIYERIILQMIGSSPSQHLCNHMANSFINFFPGINPCNVVFLFIKA